MKRTTEGSETQQDLVPQSKKTTMASAASAPTDRVAAQSFSAPLMEPTLYNLEDVDDWHTSLKSEGYAVIHNFLPLDTRERLIETFNTDFFEAAKRCDSNSLIKNMSPTDKDSWVSPDELGRKSRHAPLHIAQSNFMWGLRTQPNILNVYSHVHGVETTDLCTSMDSYSLQMKGHPSQGLPLHDDQAWGLDDRSEMYSIQGAYNFYSCQPDDTGLMIVPKSHQRWSKRRSGEVGSRHKQHFVPITPNENDYEKSYDNARKLVLPRNCFVIWNSKLLHGTCVGSRERPPNKEDQTPRLNRLTCFVSMSPKLNRSNEAYINKQMIYKTGGTSSHWSTHADCHPLNEAGAILGLVDENGDIPPDRLNLL